MYMLFTNYIYFLFVLLEFVQVQQALLESPVPRVKITILYEQTDDIVSSLIAHLNASLLFFRDQYGLDDGLIFFDPFLLPHAATNISTNATGLDLSLRQRNSSFLISLCSTHAVREVTRRLMLPAIQIHHSPWNGVENETMNGSLDPSEEENFLLHLVPGFVVFDNIIPELIYLLNMTGPIVVIFDEQSENLIHDWRKPFTALPVPVRFEKMFSDLSAASMHIKQLSDKAKYNVFIVASAKSAELYIHASVSHFESRNFRRFIVLSKDTATFKCEQCISADIFWIRMTSNSHVQTLRAFNEFLRQEELEYLRNYHTTLPTFEEIRASFCLDTISLAFDFFLKNNYFNISNFIHDSSKNRNFSRTLKTKLPYLNTPETNKIPQMEEKISLKQLILDIPPQECCEFGSYELYFGDCYYQVVTAIILKIERRVHEPDVDYAKFIANWSLVEGIAPFYSGGLDVNVRNLHHYRIVTILQEPFVQFASEHPSTISLERPRPCASEEPVRLINGQLVEGYCIDMLKMLKLALNFTFDLYLVGDGKFGSIDENGNWDGLIGELVVGRAEIAIGPISILAERENDIDFTVPFYDLVGLSILIKRSEVETSLFKFLKVLEWPVWACIFGAYVFTSMLLWLFDRFSPYSYTNNREKYSSETEKREFTLKECLWFCMTSLTPQGGGEAPKNISGRLVAATWWLFGFIIIASYTANLAAFLTVSRMEQTIGGLDDLAKQYKIEYAPLKGGATETYFRRMAEIEEQFYNIWKHMSLNESSLGRAKLAVWDYPVSDKFTNMWRFMQESRLPQTLDEAVDRVLNSDRGFAFIGDAMEIKYATLTNCRLQQIGPEFSRKPYAIAVQTDHVLKEPLSQAILKLQNERRLETCKERWWHRNEHAKECESSDDDSNGISVQNIGGVFLVILAGICISMLILLCEYIYYSRFQDANDVIRGTNKHLAQITGGFNCISALNYLREKKASKYSQEQHKNYQCQQFTNSAFNVD
ncbi:hypothetical protein ACQ4LE_006231 [Meloidogyne hapla]